MAFGIIPGNWELGCYDLPLRTEQNDPDTELIIQATTKILEEKDIIAGSKHASAAIEAIRQSIDHANEVHHWPGFTDLMGLWSEWIPLDDSPINTVIGPMGHRVYTMGEVHESRVIWRWLLKEREKQGCLSTVQKSILEFYDMWEARDVDRFSRYYSIAPNNHSSMAEREFFRNMYDTTTVFFKDRIRDTRIRMFYVMLVGSHLAVNARSLIEADENIKNTKVRPFGQDLHDQIFRERTFIYVENIPKVVQDVIDRCDEDTLRDDRLVPEMPVVELEPEMLKDAWWMLMIRMQCVSMACIHFLYDI
jgi:hypothetical protein